MFHICLDPSHAAGHRPGAHCEPATLASYNQHLRLTMGEVELLLVSTSMLMQP